MKRSWWAALAVVAMASASLAGCLGSDSTPTTTEDPASGVDAFVPRVVVAIIDTGIQPYHDEFASNASEAWVHPSTYLAGYPAETPALALTLDEPDLPKAEEADAKTWSNVKTGTLYWVPGTKIVGLVAIGPQTLPGGGHGTMTSSRIAGNNVSIGGPEVLLVNVYTQLSFFNPAPGEAVRWAADQPWIDLQSNSWGTPVMCMGPATDPLTGWMAAFRYAAAKQPTFVAVHNGHGNTGTLGYPSQCQDTAGPADVIAVGAMDNDRFTAWSNWMPYVSGDGCANPTADESATTGLVNTGGGTSSATPYTAGGAAKILLEARRILRDPTTGVKDGGVLAQLRDGGTQPAQGPLSDGQFTMDELRDLLFHTAVSPPTVDPSDGNACLTSVVPFAGIPPEALYTYMGYGEVNAHAVEHAIAVLHGDREPNIRPTEDSLYERDYAMRKALWG